MRNISDKIVGNNFSSENRTVYGIMWRNIVQPDRPQMSIEYDAENMQN